MGKIRVVVLFGGQSSEHVVSCMSAANVIDRIDQEKYELLLIGITEEGRWIRTECVEDIRSGSWRDGTVSAVISPDATEKCVILMDGESAERVPVDVVFPVLHGLYGEDGTVQGLLELAKIPMWAVACWHPRFPWINCSPRLSWTIWACARRSTSR